MQSYVVIFRTHVWDDRIAEMAVRARSCCASGHFVVAADETRGPLAVTGFAKVSHTDDFTADGLPGISDGNVLWWNADYVLYAARNALPGHDYYVMLEYDVFLDCDLDGMVARCAEGGIDFVAHDIRQIGPDDHWSFESASEMAAVPWWALIPLVIVSGRGVDTMRAARHALAVRHAAGRITHWPYCELFFPTAIVQAGLVMWPIERLVDASLLRFRPVLSARDPRLRKRGIAAHPVMSGPRFVQTFLNHEPPGSHYMTDGRLRDELQTEELADLRAVLGDQVAAERDGEGFWRMAHGVVPAADDIYRPWADLSHGKPATQSSHSPWSVGASAEADAARANRDPMPEDFAFHTGSDRDPWWQVDLLETCAVERVEIVNRPEYVHRFARFRVDTSIDGAAWTTCFAKEDGAVVSSDPARPAAFTLAGQVRARFVRIVQLGLGVMHLRRFRVLGFRLEHQAPAPRIDGPDLAVLLDAPEVAAALASRVADIVHRRVLGRGYDSYDVDALAFLAAGIDSSQYAVAHMAGAQRFPDAGALHDFAAAAAPAAGMVLEFGVFSGTSINRIAAGMPGRRIHGFDSFEGLPESWRPGFGEGAFRRTDLPAVAGNVELVVGWFDRTLPDFVAAHPEGTLALLHVDCDLYSSTKTVFAHLAERIVAGTIIVFDEYFNYPEWRAHEYRAFQELVAARRIAYEYVGLVPGHQQVAVRVTHVG